MLESGNVAQPEPVQDVHDREHHNGSPQYCFFLTSELATVLPSFGRATIDGFVDVFVAHILEQPVEI